MGFLNENYVILIYLLLMLKKLIPFGLISNSQFQIRFLATMDLIIGNHQMSIHY